VIGWALESHLQASLATAALSMALEARRPAPGSLIHHSDRGVQYACGDYTDLLGMHDIQPSMSRVGNPYDNAKAESFMKTLKHEEVDGQAYRDAAAARRAIGEKVHRRGLQSPATALGTFLSTARRVRGKLAIMRRCAAGPRHPARNRRTAASRTSNRQSTPTMTSATSGALVHQGDGRHPPNPPSLAYGRASDGGSGGMASNRPLGSKKGSKKESHQPATCPQLSCLTTRVHPIPMARIYGQNPYWRVDAGGAGEPIQSGPMGSVGRVIALPMTAGPP